MCQTKSIPSQSLDLSYNWSLTTKATIILNLIVDIIVHCSFLKLSNPIEIFPFDWWFSAPDVWLIVVWLAFLTKSSCMYLILSTFWSLWTGQQQLLPGLRLIGPETTTTIHNWYLCPLKIEAISSSSPAPVWLLLQPPLRPALTTDVGFNITWHLLTTLHHSSNSRKTTRLKSKVFSLESLDIAEMNKYPQDKFCLDKCRGDSCNLLYMFPGPFV